MIELIAAASIAVAPAKPPSKDMLACLAYLSRAPEYAAKTDAQIAGDDAFFEAAKDRYCSDEVYPLWPVAHKRARKTLGLPPKGQPGLEQQPLAEKEVRAMLGEAWALVGARRFTLRPSAKQLKGIMDSWLTDEAQATLLETVVAPITCSEKPVREASDLKPQTLILGKASPAFEKIADNCEYPAAQARLSQALQARFPDAGAKLADSVARSFIRQMTFWAALGQ